MFKTYNIKQDQFSVISLKGGGAKTYGITTEKQSKLWSKNNQDVLKVEICDFKTAGCLISPGSEQSRLKQEITAWTKGTKGTCKEDNLPCLQFLFWLLRKYKGNKRLLIPSTESIKRTEKHIPYYVPLTFYL